MDGRSLTATCSLRRGRGAAPLSNGHDGDDESLFGAQRDEGADPARRATPRRSSGTPSSLLYQMTWPADLEDPWLPRATTAWVASIRMAGGMAEADLVFLRRGPCTAKTRAAIPTASRAIRSLPGATGPKEDFVIIESMWRQKPIMTSPQEVMFVAERKIYARGHAAGGRSTPCVPRTSACTFGATWRKTKLQRAPKKNPRQTLDAEVEVPDLGLRRDLVAGDRRTPRGPAVSPSRAPRAARRETPCTGSAPRRNQPPRG